MEVSRKKIAYSDCNLRKCLSKIQELCVIISKTPGQEQVCSRATQGDGHDTHRRVFCVWKEQTGVMSPAALKEQSRAWGRQNYCLTAAPTWCTPACKPCNQAVCILLTAECFQLFSTKPIIVLINSRAKELVLGCI